MKEELNIAIIKASISLGNMVKEMLNKQLELKRITKTASLLINVGVVSPVIINKIRNQCINEIHQDGGWVSVVDTMWNLYFLKLANGDKKYIRLSEKFIIENEGINHLWGRSKRDFERIPVSGVMLYFHNSLSSIERLYALEKLWLSEKNSLTYKAAYTLMAFGKNKYIPRNERLIIETIDWLIHNQRKDGSFAPWKSHPVASDTYCTSVALLGLLSYNNYVPISILIKAIEWLLNTQLSEGIWPYHEIEDGSSWALYALYQARRRLFI